MPRITSIVFTDKLPFAGQGRQSESRPKYADILPVVCLSWRKELLPRTVIFVLIGQLPSRAAFRDMMCPATSASSQRDIERVAGRGRHSFCRLLQDMATFVRRKWKSACSANSLSSIRTSVVTRSSGEQREGRPQDTELLARQQ